MVKEQRVITRRDFIKTGSCLALGGVMGWPLVGHGAHGAGRKSRVVLIRARNAVTRQGMPDPEVMAHMLDRALMALNGVKDPVSAWKQLFGPEDVVGVKSNVWHHLPTPMGLVEAIGDRLADAGVAGSNVAVSDRGVLRNAVFERANALINVRPMRTHHWSGLGTLLKNYIMFVPAPWKYHGNACESLGAIWNLPHVKGKTRLNILVMLTPLFHGTGPHHFNPQYVWPYSGLIVSRDPVAADATGARIIQAKRNAHFGSDSPISPPPLHIHAADARYGLGHSRPENIDLLRLGWQEEVLI